MDKCDACKPGRLCDEHLERDFQRMKGVVYSRGDEYLRALRTSRGSRPTTEEVRLEAAHRVRDLTTDQRLLERYASEFIVWLAIRSIMPLPN